jgi:glycosyltransferase involved in cell wall biosynthesis
MGGAEKLLILECNTLVNKNISVTLITYYITPDLSKLLNPSVNLICLFPQRRYPNLFLDLLPFFKLIKYCNSNKSVNYITSCGYLELFVISKIFGINYSLVDHHPLTMLPKDSIRSSFQLKKKIEKYYPESLGFNDGARFNSFIKTLLFSFRFYIYKKIYNRAFIVFVLSKYAQNEKKKLVGINTFVLQGGIRKKIKQLIKSVTKTDNNKFDINSKRIISISRLSSNKNIDLLIIAFNISKLYREGYVLEIFGKGDELSNLKKLVIKLNLLKFVSFNGYLNEDDINDEIYRSEIFVNLDYADYNISVIEALALDIKILTFEKTYIAPSIEKNASITKTSLFDIDIIANKLVECAKIRHKKRPLEKIDNIIEVMSWEKRADIIISLFSE